MCVVNGRGEPNMDNYTSVSPRGHAVVDYIITPYECLENVTEWNDSVLQAAKLRIYRTLKFSIGKEGYLNRFLSVQQRSAVARFRCVSFPLAVELGR